MSPPPPLRPTPIVPTPVHVRQSPSPQLPPLAQLPPLTQLPPLRQLPPLAQLPPMEEWPSASRSESQYELEQQIKTAPDSPPPRNQPNSPTALSMMIAAGPPNMQAQQQQPSVPNSASRATAFAAPGDLPQFNWQPPSRLLTENAASLVANPLMQVQQPAEMNPRDPMIGVHAAAPMALLQQVSAAQQNAVHFASPLQ